MTVILSHRTAALYHATPNRPADLPTFPDRKAEIRAAAPTAEELARAKELLVAFGVPPWWLEALEVLVGDHAQRRSAAGVKYHVSKLAVPAHSLIRLAAGIYVVDIRLCAQQAATYLDRAGLVEYYCDICSAYERPFDEDDDYRARPPLTTVAKLRRYIEAIPGAHGNKDALWALQYVREGARSPMEVALLMAIVLPKRMGGLGIKSVEIDYKLPVAKHAAGLTRRGCFYLDLFVPGARLDIEYNGVIHEDDGNDAIDEERRNALDAMGYSMISVTRHSFFNAVAFQRVIAAIFRKCDMRASRMPSDFPCRQEYLRQFVLRRWL